MDDILRALGREYQMLVKNERGKMRLTVKQISTNSTKSELIDINTSLGDQKIIVEHINHLKQKLNDKS